MSDLSNDLLGDYDLDELGMPKRSWDCPTCRKYLVSNDCPCPKCGPTQEARE